MSPIGVVECGGRRSEEAKDPQALVTTAEMPQRQLRHMRQRDEHCDDGESHAE